MCQIASPEKVLETVDWAIDSSAVAMNSDRRISERSVSYLPIEIQQIDDEEQFVGGIISAVTRDVSVGGIGIISPAVIETKKLQVRFSSDPDSKPLLMELNYCNPVSVMYFAGASFCVDWSS